MHTILTRLWLCLDVWQLRGKPVLPIFTILTVLTRPWQHASVWQCGSLTLTSRTEIVFIRKPNHLLLLLLLLICNVSTWQRQCGRPILTILAILARS